MQCGSARTTRRRCGWATLRWAPGSCRYGCHRGQAGRPTHCPIRTTAYTPQPRHATSAETALRTRSGRCQTTKYARGRSDDMLLHLHRPSLRSWTWFRLEQRLQSAILRTPPVVMNTVSGRYGWVTQGNTASIASYMQRALSLESRDDHGRVHLLRVAVTEPASTAIAPHPRDATERNGKSVHTATRQLRDLEAIEAEAACRCGKRP